MTTGTRQNLPSEFVRINWVSEQSRQRYEELIRSCSVLFTNLEREAVKSGLKKVTIQSVDPIHLTEYSRWWIRNGFAVIPIDKMQSSNVYQSSGGSCDLSKPWTYKVAIGRPRDVSTLMDAYEERNDDAIGEILDYPRCCTDFFKKFWVQDKWIDTSLPMANGGVFGGGRINYLDWSPYCNVLLRWLGLRFVSHLPCSFTCAPSQVIGKDYRELANGLGHRTLADALYDLLGQSLEWSGLHGIGLVITPYLRVEFRTDMLDEKHMVRLINSTTKPLKMHTDKPNANGFYSDEAEMTAHNLLLDVIRVIPSVRSVIDLGCGDMKLLAKIRADFGAVTVGIDSDENKHPTIVADIFEFDYIENSFDLALISRNRIDEKPNAWLRLAKVLERKIKFLLVYSYDDKPTLLNIDNFEFKVSARSGHNGASLYERV